MSNLDRAYPKFTSLINMETLGRAFLVALVLGSVLTLINQSGALFGTDTFQVLPFVLVYLTPFVVVTISQALGVRRAIYDTRSTRARAHYEDAFLATALSHGIPLRAFLLAVVTGTLNTSLVAVAALMANGSLSDIPVGLTVQAFVLPLLFGVISQAISYRRAVKASSQQLQPTSQALPA